MFSLFKRLCLTKIFINNKFKSSFDHLDRICSIEYCYEIPFKHEVFKVFMKETQHSRHMDIWWIFCTYYHYIIFINILVIIFNKFSKCTLVAPTGKCFTNRLPYLHTLRVSYFHTCIWKDAFKLVIISFKWKLILLDESYFQNKL